MSRTCSPRGTDRRGRRVAFEGVMSKRHLPSACLVLLVACSGSGDDGSGDDGTSPPPSVLGRYDVRSGVRIDVPTQITEIANTFESEGLDPPIWLCAATAARVLDAGLASALVSNCDGIVRQSINDHLLQIAPDVPAALLSLADDLPALVQTFGVRSELRIEAVATDLVANHRVYDVVFGDRAIPFLDFGIGVNIETDIVIDWSAPRLGIADHELAIWLGTVSRMALDRIALPAFGASDLHGLYSMVNCTELGETIFDAFGQGSAAVFESACTGAMEDAAASVYAALEALDQKVPRLQLTATADALDTDGDGSVDRISGPWSGTLRENGTAPGTLSASF